jgi:hypothetical protein
MSHAMWDARGADLRPHTQLEGVDKLREWLGIS